MHFELSVFILKTRTRAEKIPTRSPSPVCCILLVKLLAYFLKYRFEHVYINYFLIPNYWYIIISILVRLNLLRCEAVLNNSGVTSVAVMMMIVAIFLCWGSFYPEVWQVDLNSRSIFSYNLLVNKERWQYICFLILILMIELFSYLNSNKVVTFIAQMFQKTIGQH